LAIDAGFQTIISMDVDPANTEFCFQRFGTSHAGINLLTGDSATGLMEVILDIEQPITFWLDAHAQHLENEPEYPNPYPLLDELDQIREHPINTHTIMIDDILHLTHPEITGWTRETIENELKRINPAYKLTYFANPVKNNILVAHL
jgi:hypothetical protein